MLTRKKVIVHPTDGRQPYYATRYVNEEGKTTKLTRGANVKHEIDDNEDDDDESAPTEHEERIKHLQKKVMTEKDKGKLANHKAELESLKKRKDSGKSYLDMLHDEVNEENKKDIKLLEHNSNEDEEEIDHKELEHAHIEDAEEDADEDDDPEEYEDDGGKDDEDEEDEEDDDPEWKELTKNNKYVKSSITETKKRLIRIMKGKYK
jgi:hypothetical protein